MNAALVLWAIVAAELGLFGLFWLATARLQLREERFGTIILASFNLVMTVGLTLVALRNIWPPVLTRAGANICILAAMALLWFGGAQQLTAVTRREPFVALTVGAVCILIAQLGWPEWPNLRVAALFLGASWIISRAGWFASPELATRGEHGARAARVLRVVAVVASGWLAGRAVGGLWLGYPLEVNHESTGSYITAFGVLLALTIVNGMLAYTVVRSLMRELERMARHDSLTGLLNRRAFWERCEQRWRAWQRDASRFALICLDIDHFKSVNDSFGHSVGDQALCAVAMTLQAYARPDDDVARIGGEEMVVILDNVESQDDALIAAERLRKAVEQMVLPAEMGQRRITVSIGIALVGPSDNQPARLLERADQALYRAKREGRNCVRLDLELESGWPPKQPDSATVIG